MLKPAARISDVINCVLIEADIQFGGNYSYRNLCRDVFLIELLWMVCASDDKIKYLLLRIGKLNCCGGRRSKDKK